MKTRTKNNIKKYIQRRGVILKNIQDWQAQISEAHDRLVMWGKELDIINKKLYKVTDGKDISL